MMVTACMANTKIGNLGEGNTICTQSRQQWTTLFTNLQICFSIYTSLSPHHANQILAPIETGELMPRNLGLPAIILQRLSL